MRGVSFRTTHPFAECFALAMGRFRPLWWLIDTHAPPFAPRHGEDAGAVEGRLAPFAYDHPLLTGTTSSLWRPGTFPDLAPFLLEDGWSYLIGLHGPESAAVAAVERIADDRWLSETFFGSVDAEQATLLLAPRVGEWEAYSPMVLPLGGTLGEPALVDSARWWSKDHEPAHQKLIGPATARGWRRPPA